MMKKTVITFIFLMAICFVSGQEEAQQKLSAAIYEEEVNGDIEKAIKMYQTIVNEFTNEREVAAKAQFNIGLCYEKLGKNQASEAYNKVIAQFADQQQTAEMAKKRLDYLNTQFHDANLVDAKITNSVNVKKIYSNDGFLGDISPDGKYASYVDWSFGNIVVINLETNEKRLITDKGTWKTPNKFGDKSLWSPDGNLLAYYWISGDNHQLHIQNMKTGEDKILVETIGDFCPWPREWTSDGKYLLTTTTEKETQAKNVQLVSVNDGSVKTIKRFKEHFAFGGLSISPDRKYIVASTGSEKDKLDLRIYSVDGSYESELISFPGADRKPKWTPDGQKVVFASNHSRSIALWTVKVKNGKKVDEPELVYDGISDNYNSLRFTNNNNLVFEKGMWYSNIFIASINPDKGLIETPTQITGDRPGFYSAPFWSPDGSKIGYFERNSSASSSGVLIYDLKKRTEKELELGLYNLEQRGLTSPHWSENNKELLLSYVKENRKHEMVLVNTETKNKKYLKCGYWKVFGPDNTIIYVDSTNQSIVQKNISNGNEKLLFKNDRPIFNLVISQDKTTLAFFIVDHEGEGTQKELYTLPLDGSNAKMLWRPQKNQYFGRFGKLNFFPDNKTLLVQLSTKDKAEYSERRRQLYTINMNTLEKKPLGEELTEPAVIFDYIKLSPDGKKIAFCKGLSTTNIWSLEFDF